MGRNPENLRQEEAHAEATIYSLYLMGEETLTGISLNLLRRQHLQPRSTLPGSSEFINRIKFIASNTVLEGTNDIQDGLVNTLLNLIPLDKRSDIIQKAHLYRKEYWEEVLEQPDLPTDLIVLGKRRLTQIYSKLDELQKN